jgi:plasmid stability protein
MATLTLRNVGDELKARLRIEAAQHGHSMEAEVREILRRTLRAPSASRRLRQRFATLADPGLELPARVEPPRSPALPE